MIPVELIRAWRARGEAFKQCAARVDAGALCDAFVADVESLDEGGPEELLTMAGAVAASGYTAQQLRRLVAHGKLRSHGTGRTRLFARGDLPKKPGVVAPVAVRPHLVGATAEQVVRDRVGAT